LGAASAVDNFNANGGSGSVFAVRCRELLDFAQQLGRERLIQ